MTRAIPALCAFLAAVPAAAVTNETHDMDRTSITEKPYGNVHDAAISLYTLKNASGMSVEVTNYGGIITSIVVPDKEGMMADVALGFDTLDGYLADQPYFGATIGRYGNRIGGGTFQLDGQTVELPKNNNGNTLHGGPRGFDKRVWQADVTDGALKLTYVSRDGEMGFPGTLTSEVTFRLRDDNAVEIEYRATTDKTTVVNLTNHSYFNLAGQGNGNVLGHLMQIDASAITPVDTRLIPTGELMPVEGTPFDFRKPVAIGNGIDADHDQIRRGRGYDHNFVLDGGGAGLRLIATVIEPSSGRILEVHTTEPGVQLYSGNFLDGSLRGKGGAVYGHRSGFCLETQHFPDSPNHESFPSTTLRPGETYTSRTVYKFRVQQ